jgi:hypothetical protein
MGSDWDDTNGYDVVIRTAMAVYLLSNTRMAKRNGG